MISTFTKTAGIVAMAVLSSCYPRHETKLSTSGDRATVDSMVQSPVVAVVATMPYERKATVELTKVLKMELPEFGCWLQRNFNYVDSVFNCSAAAYVNRGDPCDNTAEYYRGVSFPVDLFDQVHPNIKNVIVEFERGKVRAVTIVLTRQFSVSQINVMFMLDPHKLPDNVMFLDYNEGTTGYTDQITITGFEHIGAADVDC